MDRIRTADEFKGDVPVNPPPHREALAGGWNLKEIRNALDDQLRGRFSRPARLAESMRTDDAAFTAYHNRIAPQSAVAMNLVAAKDSTRGEAVRCRALLSCQAPRSTMAGIVGTLANHGIAIGYVLHEVNEDGDRVDFKLTEWPLEHVWYNYGFERLETATYDQGIVPIVHGDGHWIVFRKFAVMPWTQDAALLPGALLWARRAYGLSDWAGASRSHGQAKILGSLPQGVSLQESDGNGGVRLTAEAAGYLNMLQSIVSGEGGAGLKAFGTEAQFLANGSNAWQVFSELALQGDKGFSRIYTGTDAALGSVGGAPGVDITQLFGVATTRVQGDFEALEQGLDVGFYQPWTAINYGDSRLAPRAEYQLPDPDADKKSEQRRNARQRLNDTIKEMRDLGFEVTQAYVNTLAKEYGVSPAPTLSSKPVQIPAHGVPPNPKALTGLAGDFDESKHPRSDDGKFGSGGSAAAEHDMRTPGGRLDRARERHAEAIANHIEARKAYRDAVAENHGHAQAAVKNEIDKFHAQHAKDRARAPSLLAETTAKHARAKKEAAAANQAVSALASVRGVSESDIQNIDKLRQLKEHHAITSTIPAYKSASERQAHEIADLEKHTSGAAAKLKPEDLATIAKARETRQREQDLSDSRKSLASAIRSAPKESELHKQLGDAAARGDTKSFNSILKKINYNLKLRSVIADADPNDQDEGADPSVFDGFSDSVSDEQSETEVLKKMADRAARSRATHAKIVARRVRQVGDA